MATPETKSEAESLIPQFSLEKVLNQDQNGRRLVLVGSIDSKPGLMILERAAFPSSPASLVSSFLDSITNTTNLGSNDVYRWYMANNNCNHSISDSGITTPDLKLNLIYPCTEQHIKKYSPQRLRLVTETSQIYHSHIRSYIDRQRASGRLDWVYNILEGRTEQEDVIYRTPEGQQGFLLLPDLNWDRKSVQGLHLLALLYRRDLHSIRDLRVTHIEFLRRLKRNIIEAVCFSGNVFPALPHEEKVIEPDEVKLYFHYHPTYYHLHVHVVHVGLDAPGATQAVGKAVGFESVVALLEGIGMLRNGAGPWHMAEEKKDEEEDGRGLQDLDMTYTLGEESELWRSCFGKLKNGQQVVLNS